MRKRLIYLLIILWLGGICTARQVISSSGYAARSEVSMNWVLGGGVSGIPAYSPIASAILEEELE